MCWWWLAIGLVAGLRAAPVVVFDDARDSGERGLLGSRLRLGRPGGRPGALAPDVAARAALMGEDGALPIVADRPFSGRHCLRVSVVGTDVGWWEARLPLPALVGEAAVLAKGTLVLAVRGTAGDEPLEIGLLDHAVPCHAVRLPLVRYGDVTRNWRVFRVPLADFLAVAPQLDLTRLDSLLLLSVRPEPMTIDLDRLVLDVEGQPAPPPEPPTPPTPPRPTPPAPVTPIVPAPAVGAVLPPAVPVEPGEATRQPGPAPRPLTSQPTALPAPAPERTGRVLASVFSGGLPGPWPASELRAAFATQQGERMLDPGELQANFEVADGARLPVVVDPSRPGSVLKLAVRQEGFAWWVARLGCPPTDLSAAVRDGWLELAVRGAVGDEEFRLGVTDGQARPELAALPLRRGPLGATGWRTVRVTLAALAVENPRLDWSRVAGVVLTSAHGRPLTLWLTAVKLVD